MLLNIYLFFISLTIFLFLDELNIYLRAFYLALRPIFTTIPSLVE